MRAQTPRAWICCLLTTTCSVEAFVALDANHMGYGGFNCFLRPVGPSSFRSSSDSIPSMDHEMHVSVITGAGSIVVGPLFRTIPGLHPKESLWCVDWAVWSLCVPVNACLECA